MNLVDNARRRCLHFSLSETITRARRLAAVFTQMAPFIVLEQDAHLLSRRMRQKDQFACLQKDAKFAGAAGLSESVMPSPFEAGSRKRSEVNAKTTKASDFCLSFCFILLSLSSLQLLLFWVLVGPHERSTPNFLLEGNCGLALCVLSKFACVLS